MIRLAFAAPLCVLLIFGGTVRAEEGETLGPTPHATADVAIGRAEARGWARSREAQPAVAADVVGAITPLTEDRVGFMPLLQHHMAVEHWFLEGPEVAELALKAREAGGRGFVRLRGTLTLLGVFGGEGLEWYGTGLQHGRDWGPVMGYHERVYRFAVEEVVWVRTRPEQAAAQQAAADLQARLQADMKRLDYAAAAKSLDDVVEGANDAGLDVRGFEKVRDYLRRMLILERDAETWSDADAQVVAEAIVLEPHAPYKELARGAAAKLIARIETWPAGVREGLGPRAVAAWMALRYRHQRDKARPVLFALDASSTRALAEELPEAEARIEEAKARLKALAGTDDYAGMLAVLEGAARDQALVMDYALGEDRTGHWVPAARRLAALKDVMGDPGRREELLTSQIRETVASGTGLPNSNAKPRYNPEVNVRFAPRLSAPERERIETLLLELAKSLRVSDDWKQVLLVAELLSGFGGERSRAYFPALLRRTSRRPKWQREHLQRFAAAMAKPEAAGDARYERHVKALKKRLPDRGKAFTIVTQPPFVVIGDGKPAVVRKRAKNTVKWAVDRLKEAYFSKDPAHIIDVYLFKDAVSYESHAKTLFGDEPPSPYGYYSPKHRALIMNIATGGGTLVHEIVHPFVAANFPACPAWFNEGLASLYEQCGDRDGEIVGYVNWRLPILQQAIRDDALSSFEDLCATTTRAFYGRGRGANYAQARYLCFYLQEHGLLREYYRAFAENHETDPTGYQTLVKVLEEGDMEKFQRRWETDMLELRFR